MEDKFVIEVVKGNRFFFICEFEGTQHMTWDKKFAKKFDSKEEAQEYIHENDYSYTWKATLKIKKYSEVSSH